MKQIRFILLFSIGLINATSKSLEASEVSQKQPCSLVELRKIDLALESEKIETKVIEKFVWMLDSNCSSASEFSEVSNEVVFKMLQMEMNSFMDIVGSRQTSDRQKRLLLFQVENPVHDGIPLSAIKDMLAKSKYSKTKFGKQLSTSLQVAIDKSK